MEDRTVLQWDKDDCAAAGLVKFDLLGLGMLSALHYAVDLVREHHGVEVDLATIPQEDEVYDMLCRADSVGVFQVESRAQMATLPRLKPRTFYDLVVEVALIRPGPIQGGSVHPYIRRRNGQEPVTYLHPLLEPALARPSACRCSRSSSCRWPSTSAGFTAGEADQLRQAMGSKRSRERMERLHQRFYDGMAERGVTGDTVEEHLGEARRLRQLRLPREPLGVLRLPRLRVVVDQALLPGGVLRRALLNAQPMGFYSPHSLVQDARRHGVEVRTPDLNASAAGATLETDAGSGDGADRRRRRCLGHGRPPVRLGIGSVRGIGEDLADDRRPAGPYADGGPGRRVPAHAAAAGGAGHRRRLRLLRARAGGRRCGRRGRWPSRARAGWPASSPASTPRPCRA